MAIPAAKINISWESVGKHTQAQCSHHVFCAWKMPTGTFFFLSLKTPTDNKRQGTNAEMHRNGL